MNKNNKKKKLKEKAKQIFWGKFVLSKSEIWQKKRWK